VPDRPVQIALFETTPRIEALDAGVARLAAFADTAALRAFIADVAAVAPFRHMAVKGGRRMAVAMTNAGRFGWLSDRDGYRYSDADPETGRPWPALPEALLAVADAASRAAGFAPFAPDACLIGRYEAGAGLGLHQDRDEGDLAHPIVSVSVGAAASFILGGLRRDAPTRRIRVEDGDVIVWGGESRLRFHGVAPLRPRPDGATVRYNLSFRRVAV